MGTVTNRKGNVVPKNYQTEEVDPTRTDDAETIYEPLIAPWKADKAPDIEDRFFRQIVPIQQTPADRVAFYTYTLTAGPTGQPVRITERQPEGIACRVRVTNVSDVTGQDVAITADHSSAGFITTLGAVASVQNGYVLRSYPGAPNEFTIETKAELFLVPLLGSAITVTVCVETYELWY
jgi:hypothetical protein